MNPLAYFGVFFFNLIVIYLAFTCSTKLKSLDEISALQNNYTFVRDKDNLLDKLNNIIEEGYDRLQIITDFDLTLTVDLEGKRALNSFEMFRLCPSIPQSYKDEEYKLYLHYKPIESDPNITVQEKSKQMLEWYKAAHNLMKGLRFPREELKNIARNGSDTMRHGVRELITWSNNNNVPVLVLSSGLGDSVVAALEAANLMSLNVKVISNFLEVDSNDIIIGMKGETIHSYNKNEASIKHTDYYQTVKERNNVLLMGDSIGDANMTDGMDDLSNIVKIGFLNSKNIDSMPTYTNNFDIILVNDSTMNVANALLKLIR